MKIEELSVRLLKVPLSVPYKLAFGAVREFDIILVRLTLAGREGLGEAAILNGYTDETVEGGWHLATEIASRLKGASPDDLRAICAPYLASSPFVTTAFVTALEMAEGHPLLDVEIPTEVPLLFGINATDSAGIAAEMERAWAAGYRTLKIKAGFDLAPDLARVGLIQRLNAGRMRLRVDANQGYSPDEGVRFACGLSPDSIELLEQPCAAEDWKAAAEIARVTPVPLMLDESIYNLADIDRAAEIGAGYVKLKLMKLGSLTALAQGVARIRELGMQPVLGNGVASDIGCWMEACVAARCIDNAGEMNGYLRQRQSLAGPAIAVAAGAMQLAPGLQPRLDWDRVQRCTVGSINTRAA